MLARAKEAEAKQAADQQKKDYLDALSFVAAANERALQTYGEQLGSIAKELQADVSGKNVRSYSEALATVEKIRANPKFRLNIQDRQATINAINALDKATFAENINRLGKAFGVVGKIVQAEKIYDTTVHGFQTEDWKPLMLELEALALGIGAGALVVVGMAFFFPVFTVTTLGIIAVAMILALVSSLIDSKLADRINNVIFS
ncbi:colicin-like pore-forming protein [Pseudomonas antarctica]|uniref:colicin-like pore-forming protein n=1 Tax=Pseudomonas antarctica TaxID=219572 RepID=UPI003F752B6F